MSEISKAYIILILGVIRNIRLSYHVKGMRQDIIDSPVLVSLGLHIGLIYTMHTARRPMTVNIPAVNCHFNVFW